MILHVVGRRKPGWSDFGGITTNEDNEWKRRMETTNGNDEWEQRMGTMSGDDEWGQRMGTTSGYGGTMLARLSHSYAFVIFALRVFVRFRAFVVQRYFVPS